MITRADGVWFTMTLGLVMNEEESPTNQFTMLITLRCTLTQSVLLRFRCGDTSASTRNYMKAKWNEPWTQRTDVSRAQNKRGLRITRNNQLWQIRYITRVVETRKNNKGRLADGIRQRTGRDNLDRYHSWRNLITLLDLCVTSPHCLPINHHKNQLDMVVGITWSSQHRHLNRLGMSICSPKTRIILIGMCGWYLNGWKEAEYGSHVDLEEPTSFLHHVYVGCNQRECKSKRKYHWWVQRNVRITNLCRSNWKVTWLEKSHANTLGHTIWKDTRRNAWNVFCKNGKQHTTCSSALRTMDDASYFLVIRLVRRMSLSCLL